MPQATFYTSRSGCLSRILILSIAVIVGAWLLPGVDVESFLALLLTAMVISVLDNILRPILIVITLPVTVITLGLFIFVINAIIILLASAIVEGFHVANFASALLFSLILTAINYLLELPNRFINSKKLGPRTNTDDTDSDVFTPYEEVE